MTPQQLEETGSQLMLGNTYHLENRPGSGRVARLGGLQEFTGWRRPMLTDSGGFQVGRLSASILILMLHRAKSQLWPLALALDLKCMMLTDSGGFQAGQLLQLSGSCDVIC